MTVADKTEAGCWELKAGRSICSECGSEIWGDVSRAYRFCPCCGEKMGDAKSERQRRYKMNIADVEGLFDAISICKNPAASKAEREDAEERACAAARSMARSVTGNVVDVETLGQGFLKMAIIFFYWKKNYRTACSTEEFCQILSAMGIDTFEND